MFTFSHDRGYHDIDFGVGVLKIFEVQSSRVTKNMDAERAMESAEHPHFVSPEPQNKSKECNGAENCICIAWVKSEPPFDVGTEESVVAPLRSTQSLFLLGEVMGTTHRTVPTPRC